MVNTIVRGFTYFYQKICFVKIVPHIDLRVFRYGSLDFNICMKVVFSNKIQSKKKQVLHICLVIASSAIMTCIYPIQ